MSTLFAFRATVTLFWLGAAAGTFGCGVRYWVCDELDDTQLETLPERLSQTGLFTGAPVEELAVGVRSYHPEFALWSDGATKRRWFWLPEGTTIDSADPDDWSFPIGTKFWKEFTRDGTRVETRLLTRSGAGESDWTGAAYVWDSDQLDAWIKPYGSQDTLGTPHDVPAANECSACHGGRSSYVLGFSAIQLAHAPEPGEVALDTLKADALLSQPLEVTPSVPGTSTERSALGYLHANCGHCHNQERPKHDGSRCFDPNNRLDFWLTLDALDTVADTPTLHSFTSVVKPGNPHDSRLIELVSQRGFLQQMPPLASERVDSDALQLLSDFIGGL